MIDGHKVVVWTPYGREETMSILTKYIARDHAAGVVDEYWLYMNTDENQVRDREYAHELAEQYSFIKLKERPLRPGEQPFHPKQLNTGLFYRYAIEPNTVWVRLDDDLVYVHPQAIANLVRHKLSSPGLVSFPLIWHNAICSYYLQTMGKIPHTWGTVGAPYCMDSIGWASPQFAEGIHRILLDHIRADTVDSLFLHHDIQLPVGLQFSVSCFASTSDIYTELPEPGHIYHEEETWHTVQRPSQTGRANVITGNSLVSHLSFFPHTEHIRRGTDILDQYRELADNL